jgi:hypothetical protein
MKERKKGSPIRLFFIAGVSVLFLFCGCDMPSGGYWEYTFENQTQYTIQVSLNEGYKLVREVPKENGESSPVYTAPLQIYNKSSKTVYIRSGSVDFEWTASSPGNNRSIYPVNTGSKVTFKERDK